MKMTNRIAISLLAGTLVLVGCGKEKTKSPVQQGITTEQGVTIDVPKLSEAFAGAGPEIQNSIMAVTAGVRYGEYGSALVALNKLAKTPGLTDAQKQIISEVTEQVKEAASKAGTAPPR